MDQSANLSLPYIMPSQAQKHVTHNEAIRTLDALVQLAVLDRHLASPPISPSDGNRYIVAAAASGAWTAREGQVAAWQDGAWVFLAPRPGWLAFVADEARLVAFDGAAWIDAAVHSLNPAPRVGVNTTADDTNRLAVRSPASLFDQESGDHRLKVNKAAPGDTASVLFQTGYSGRAEFGLAGNDDWSVKVSPDGSAWVEALRAEAATGRVLLPIALPLVHPEQVVTRRHVREVLAADRTYYVRADGSDSNDGLADSAGGAFLTIAKAVAAAVAIDPSTYNVTIQLQDGTWTVGPSIATPMLNNKPLTLRGNLSTPASCVIAGATSVSASGAGVSLNLAGLSLNGTLLGINCSAGATVGIGAAIVFGAASSQAHMRTNGPGSTINVNADYAITAASPRHFYASPNGFINCFNRTVTLSGTLNFSSAFAFADRGALISTNASTFTGGTVTGKRYEAQTNAVIYTGGAGASHYPGSIAGTTATGGQYG